VVGLRQPRGQEKIEVSTTAAAPRGGLLIWLSGADTDALARCPRERRKFVGVGGAVLTTAALAAISATFALYAGVRTPFVVAVAVGPLWGLAILNLDRWLVGATQRRDRWYQNLVLALPRLILALVIGAVVSTPLVLWIFQSEIQAEMKIMQQEELDARQRQLDNNERFAEIDDLEQEIDRLQGIVHGTVSGAADADPTVIRLRQEFGDLTDRYQQAQEEANKERDGQGGTGNVGAGPVFQLKQRQANELKAERDVVKGQLDTAINQAESAAVESAKGQRAEAVKKLPGLQSDLADRLAEKRLDEARLAASTRNNEGLLAQMAALTRFTSQDSTLRIAYLALLLFITAIEILPVLVKLLMSLGPPTLYDRIVRAAEDHDIETAKVAFAHERTLAAHEIETRGEQEVTLVDQMVAADVDVRSRAIDRWRTEQLGRADIDPTGIVRQQRIARVGLVSQLRTLLRRRLSVPRPRDRSGASDFTAWPAQEADAGRPAEPSATGPSTADADDAPRWTYQ